LAAAPLKGPAEPAPRKLSYKEQRELDALPALIEALEAEQKEIGERLASATLYTDEPQRAPQLQVRFEAIESELMQALERWEGLGSR
jgi:ABC transport system ATP-binding/permease protein